MYYIRVSGTDDNNLIYYCRKCGHEDESVTKESIVVSKTSTSADKAAYLNNINEFTKLDPTLPRVTNVPCPNKDCPSNRVISDAEKASASSARIRINPSGAEGAAAAAAAAASAAAEPEEAIEVGRGEVPREVIYMRYDDVNMKYVYICARCDTVWRPDILGLSE
jgi:DNA-directed RNA polymerase subunit M/transcription elongation factor TFIIS